MDRLPPLTDALYGLAALFRAAASGPGDGGSGPTAAQQEALGHLQRVLQPVYAILEAVGRVVDGLIILIPLGASAIAWLIAQLDRLKLVFLELMQFLLRNVFLLSGVVLVTVYDTLSSAMRLASGLLGILRDFAGHILRALFNSLADLVRVTLSALQFVAGRLAAAVDPLLDYVVERLFWVLNNLAQTPVFRVIYHVIDVLPTMLPALVRLVRDVNLSGAEQRRLRALPRLPALTMTAPTVTPFRTTGADLAAAFAPSPELTALEGDIRTLGAGMENTVNFFVGEAQGALRRMGGLLEREAATLSTRITEHTRVVRRRADELAAALRPAVAAGEQRPPTGLDRVARAYEQWIAGGGLNAMLGLITNHFRRTPEATRRLADTVALERARATVEIAEVVVEVETAAVRRADEAASLLPEPSLVDQVVEGLRDRLERGAPPSLDAFGFA
ncbi:MAG: hypothetical protein HKN04_09440 [Rhodothermaceae bacterium]|nr:hypothetical protein [Rhodothermaceae bacterium]